MALENYRDISDLSSDMSAGFQFEFFCNRCSRNWKSDFTPYRMGQFAGILSRLAPLLGAGRGPLMNSTTGLSGVGKRSARADALAAAMQHAARRYAVCAACRKEACIECFDAQREQCLSCIETAASLATQPAQGSDGPTAGASCANCRAAVSGGRFCAECGFDMSSTHKSCPACGAMSLRQARFCTDCGHGY